MSAQVKFLIYLMSGSHSPGGRTVLSSRKTSKAAMSSEASEARYAVAPNASSVSSVLMTRPISWYGVAEQSCSIGQVVMHDYEGYSFVTSWKILTMVTTSYENSESYTNFLIMDAKWMATPLFATKKFYICWTNYVGWT